MTFLSKTFDTNNLQISKQNIDYNINQISNNRKLFENLIRRHLSPEIKIKISKEKSSKQSCFKFQINTEKFINSKKKKTKNCNSCILI